MTPTGETILAYSGGVIDRAANQRSDPGWIDATGRLGREDSIDRYLLRSWLDEAS
jgi:hypothetical protein